MNTLLFKAFFLFDSCHSHIIIPLISFSAMTFLILDKIEDMGLWESILSIEVLEVISEISNVSRLKKRYRQNNPTGN